MADYKTGVSPIDSPRDNWQAKAYTLGAFQAFPEVEEIIFVSILIELINSLINLYLKIL